MALVETENSIVYSNEEQEVSYQLYDILWSDGKATQEVRPVSDGVVPIGLCVIPTGWLDEGEKARFVSLKYMSGDTPESGSVSKYRFFPGQIYSDYGSPAPGKDPLGSKNDPLKEYYFPYVYKETDNSADTWRLSGNMDMSQKENWVRVYNRCKQHPNTYALGDINGIQNTINISIEGNWYENLNEDMKYCVSKYEPKGTKAGDWYVPALGELSVLTCLCMDYVGDNSSLPPDFGKRIAPQSISKDITRVYPEYCSTALFDDNNFWSSTIHSYSAQYASYPSSLTHSERNTNWDGSVAFLQR